MDDTRQLLIRQLGLQPYESVWQRMKVFTDARTPATPDEVWCLQHPPVFTLGQAGKTCHLLAPGEIPVVKSDRGGQVTYHGPGQLVLYLLFNLQRLGLGPRRLVSQLEDCLLETLAAWGVAAQTRKGAPGVYVQGKKIASLGLRIRKGCTYHGISFNMAMDLSPFSRINVCGFEGLQVTQLSDWVAAPDEQQVTDLLCRQLINRLGYTSHESRQGWSNADD